jgi:tetratricopeptide (TPR) repeat protein
VVLLAIAVTFIKPGVWSIVNHPYQYLYFNELAGGIEGANGNYEIDYWNQSPREAFKWLINNHPEIKSGDYKVSSNNIQESLKTFNPEGDSVTYAWTREYEWCNNDWSYAIWTSRTLSKNQILGGYWPPKGTIHEVKVDGVTVAAVVKSPNNYSNLAYKYLRNNQGDSALYFYNKCFEWNPLEEEYARGIGNACKMIKKYDSAIKFYNKAIALRDGNYDALQSLGDVYFTKAYDMNPNDPDKGMMSKAYDCYSQAFKHKKNSSAPLYMGEINLMNNKALEAKNNYNQFLETYGNVSRGYLGLAKAQLQLNETDSALYNFQVAIQLEPKDPQPYYYLGTELQRLGRNQEAEQFLNEFRKLTGQPAQ